MNSRERRRKYTRLSSMDELMKQKRKLEIDIKRQEIRLLDDLYEVKDFFSFSNLSDMVVDMLYDKLPIVRNAKIAYRVIASLITGRRSKNSECVCDEEV